jgi:hypothetical protein
VTEKTYLYVGDHAETLSGGPLGDDADPLSGGRRVDPGDRVPAGAVDPNDPHDKQLLDDGLLLDTAKAKKEANS